MRLLETDPRVDTIKLQHVTSSADSPISSLSYSSFRGKLQAMCCAVGISRSMLHYSMHADRRKQRCSSARRFGGGSEGSRALEV